MLLLLACLSKWEPPPLRHLLGRKERRSRPQAPAARLDDWRRRPGLQRRRMEPPENCQTLQRQAGENHERTSQSL
eukprot:1537232-Pyramimonas_sp.AAC.1